MSDIKWIFMVYVARSGSTYFASQLAKATSQILVLPETKIVDLLVSIDAEIFRDMSAASKLSLVKSDPRWDNLEITDGEFSQVCVEAQSAVNLLNKLVGQIASKAGLTPTHVLIKNGASVWNYEKLSNAFAEASFLHVYRDPRGSTSSRMNKIPVYKEKAGARLADPWFLTQHWVRYIERVETMKRSGLDIFEVPYEELMLNPSLSVDSYLAAVGIQRIHGEKNVFKLSEKEVSGKHANVNSPPIKERLEAWKMELSTNDGALIELLCEKYIDNNHFRKNMGFIAERKILILGFLRYISIGMIRFKERLYLALR